MTFCACHYAPLIVPVRAVVGQGAASYPGHLFVHFCHNGLPGYETSQGRDLTNEMSVAQTCGACSESNSLAQGKVLTHYSLTMQYIVSF